MRVVAGSVQRFVLVLAVVGCGSPPATLPQRADGRPPLSATGWTQRCHERIELARLSLARLEPAFAKLAYTIDTRPWGPSVHFETRTDPNGLWWGNVARGEPCLDEKRPGFSDWRDEVHDPPLLVDRYMRIGEDIAWLQADHVPQNTALAFRRELQFALRECLLDAQGVALESPPPELCTAGDDGTIPDDL